MIPVGMATSPIPAKATNEAMTLPKGVIGETSP